MNWNPTNWLARFLVVLAPPVKEVDFEKPAVVMVHGIFDTGTKMAWLASKFAQKGYEVFCPSLVPASGKLALKELSKQLDEQIYKRFPDHRRLHLVGFSMGGLILRYWLLRLACLSRIASFSTLGTPHRGTFSAYFHKGAGVQDMRPGSEFLLKLEAEDERLHTLQALSLYTPLDLMILPSSSSRWKTARNEQIWILAHPLMVFSPRIAARLLNHFEARE